MVGAEGFEVSFPSDHFALSSFGFEGKRVQFQRFPKISGMPYFPYSLTNGSHSARNWYHWYHLPKQSWTGSRICCLIVTQLAKICLRICSEITLLAQRETLLCRSSCEHTRLPPCPADISLSSDALR